MPLRVRNLHFSIIKSSVAALFITSRILSDGPSTATVKVFCPLFKIRLTSSSVRVSIRKEENEIVLPSSVILFAKAGS